MDVEFIWLFVFTFFSKVILTSSVEIKYGRIRVLRKHFAIRKCADELLKHDEYVGMRISHLTGDCEGLSHSWGRNQTIEIGYGYMKKISVQKQIYPPAEFPYRVRNVWTTDEFPYRDTEDVWNTIIPGILNTGARVDLHLTGRIEGSSSTLLIVLSEKGVRSRAKFVMRMDDVENKIYMSDIGIRGFPDAFYYSTDLKISFVAQNTSLQVLFDDKVLGEVNSKDVRLKYLTQVFAYRSIVEIPRGIFISRFEFSEA